MKLIIGLGNPGKEYEKTRHNIGRRLIERIAASEKKEFARKKPLKAWTAEVPWDCETVMLTYLESFMNLSGGPVRDVANHFGITDFKDLLLVVDDIALPFGKMRLRGEGSSGGHNGLRSVEEALQSSSYARLRIGIGVQSRENPEWSAGADEPLRDYVLSVFSKEEEQSLTGLLEVGAEACRRWAVEPFMKTAQWVNSTKM